MTEWEREKYQMATSSPSIVICIEMIIQPSARRETTVPHTSTSYVDRHSWCNWLHWPILGVSGSLYQNRSIFRIWARTLCKSFSFLINSAATATCDTMTFPDGEGEDVGEKYASIQTVLPAISPSICVLPQLWQLKLHLRGALLSVPEHGCSVNASTMSLSLLKTAVSFSLTSEGILLPLKFQHL